ncbi:NEK protein kinase [Fonticula alba]|uniref:non-specific serine/threonine protein kinase n=1 Tax=Fonticula alba TaxID=691883 RepID=A0A058ZC33_FONAL|nr:NEK protein kinase [Fonticula alba]KCV71965.1 NEK protein kinase [Fonticula alba]|eukprot:XP_009493543.1 NEK protein kinase [Fonticula alba]
MADPAADAGAPATLDQFERIEEVGHGSFGRIVKVRRRSDGQQLVWKEIDYKNMGRREKQQLVAEVNILRALRHSNIVRYFDRILDSEHCRLYVLMEFCEGGDLKMFLSKYRKERTFLDEDLIWRIFTQIVLALHECHTHKDGIILHRDLKPGNIFFLDPSHTTVKLGDFGLSRTLESSATLAQTFLGTPYYMSPEQVDHSGYNQKSDIWSLGCLLFEMCSLVPPFDAADQKQLNAKILTAQCPALPAAAQYSADLHNLVRWMLQRNQDQRPTTDQILRFRPVRLVYRERRIQKHYVKLKEIETALVTREQDLLAFQEIMRQKELALKEREAVVQAAEQQLKAREQQLALLEARLVEQRDRQQHQQKTLLQREEQAAAQLEDAQRQWQKLAQRAAGGSADGTPGRPSIAHPLSPYGVAAGGGGPAGGSVHSPAAAAAAAAATAAATPSAVIGSLESLGLGSARRSADLPSDGPFMRAAALASPGAEAAPSALGHPSHQPALAASTSYMDISVFPPGSTPAGRSVGPGKVIDLTGSPATPLHSSHSMSRSHTPTEGGGSSVPRTGGSPAPGPGEPFTPRTSVGQQLAADRGLVMTVGPGPGGPAPRDASPAVFTPLVAAMRPTASARRHSASATGAHQRPADDAGPAAGRSFPFAGDRSAGASGLDGGPGFGSARGPSSPSPSPPGLSPPGGEPGAGPPGSPEGPGTGLVSLLGTGSPASPDDMMPAPVPGYSSASMLPLPAGGGRLPLAAARPADASVVVSHPADRRRYDATCLPLPAPANALLNRGPAIGGGGGGGGGAGADPLAGHSAPGPKSLVDVISPVRRASGLAGHDPSSLLAANDPPSLLSEPPPPPVAGAADSPGPARSGFLLPRRFADAGRPGGPVHALGDRGATEPLLTTTFSSNLAPGGGGYHSRHQPAPLGGVASQAGRFVDPLRPAATTAPLLDVPLSSYSSDMLLQYHHPQQPQPQPQSQQPQPQQPQQHRHHRAEGAPTPAGPASGTGRVPAPGHAQQPASSRPGHQYAHHASMYRSPGVADSRL